MPFTIWEIVSVLNYRQCAHSNAAASFLSFLLCVTKTNFLSSPLQALLRHITHDALILFHVQKNQANMERAEEIIVKIRWIIIVHFVNIITKDDFCVDTVVKHLYNLHG